MKTTTLIANSLRFYRRTHVSVVLAAALTSAVLVGALGLGDCVRYTLRDLALSRLGEFHLALGGQDRFFRAELAQSLDPEKKRLAPAIILPGSAVHQKDERSLRANGVQVLGVDARFWAGGPSYRDEIKLADDEVALNTHLAKQLGVEIGQPVILRIPRPTALSRDVPLSPTRKATLPLRLTVRAILDDLHFGRFSLRANQVAPLNAYVPRKWLASKLGMADKANLMLAGDMGDAWQAKEAPSQLRRLLTPADLDLTLGEVSGGQVELRSGRVFLDGAVSASAAKVDPGATGVLTYFVNSISAGGKAATPYSMVAAVGPVNDDGAKRSGPWDLADDEIAINAWMAVDLGVDPDAPETQITLTYYVVGASRELKTATRTFRLRKVVAIEGLAGDRTLTPKFPGLSDSENCRDWDASLPIDLDAIRDKDEEYWDAHKGTPKAFVNLRVGREMWANRFGDLTAVRFSQHRKADELAAAILADLDPADVGLTFLPVRAQALAAGADSLDLGQYFLYLSFFLIVAAVMLTSLLFGFGVEQRSEEVGTLLAVGFTPRRVRRLLLAEGAVLAAIGAVAGVFGGVMYTRGMLWGLSTMWAGVSTGSAIRYHSTVPTLAIGVGGAFAAAIFAMWIALRRQARSRVRDLLDGTTQSVASQSRRPGHPVTLLRIVVVVFVIGLGVTVVLSPLASETAAFLLGAIVLLAGLWACHALLAAGGRRVGRSRPTMIALAIRNAGRRRWRSLTVAGLLASGCFLVVSIQAFHLDAPSDVRDRASGTGGFVLMGQTATGVFHDLNTKEGRDEYTLSGEDMAGVSIVPLRANRGDDASCLNLNRAQRVRLLGVAPGLLDSRFGQGQADPTGVWSLLNAETPDGVVPAIGDAATVVYGLGKAVGDTIDYVDGRGRPFEVKIVATVGNSILQGSLVISEEQFVNHFPAAEGHRLFLIDVDDPARETAVRERLSEALGQEGIVIVSTADRLAELNTVQNTYLSIFQGLGLLGLLLGSVGIGVVVLRGAMERRSELALMRAVGFSRWRLVWLMFLEHWGLLVMGLVVGTVAAMVGISPQLASGGAGAGAFPAMTLGLIVAAGTLWVFGGTVLALRGTLIEALRNE